MATNDKYDRQLRLWGANGQRKLAESHLLLLNAGPTGSEALKNLVLPGIGRFTIVDSNRVMPSDRGNNFFITCDAIGRPRAQVVTELLLELNPDVSGDFRQADPVYVIANEPKYFEQFSMVVATQLDPESAQLLSILCERLQKPLFILQSNGLLGYLRLQTLDHTVLESKPDPPKDDLRLSNPFEQLKTFVNQFDLEKLDNLEHSHVPYVVILMKMNQLWKDAHEGKTPATFQEKEEYKLLIKKNARGEWGHEQNFAEAYDYAYKAYVPYSVNSDVEEILSCSKALELTKDSKPFWIVANALHKFRKSHDGLLPFNGRVPDMTSTTENFIALQQVYQAKAESDRKWIQKCVLDTLQSLQLTPDTVSEEYIATFCKNASDLQAIQTRTLRQERDEPDFDDIKTTLMCEPNAQSPLLWYLLLRAGDLFYVKNKRFPGTIDQQRESDAAELNRLAQEFLADNDFEASTLTQDHVTELVRFGRSELHNIAALIGGMFAQEAVKIITHQFVPLNHTYLYNGISGDSATFQV